MRIKSKINKDGQKRLLRSSDIRSKDIGTVCIILERTNDFKYCKVIKDYKHDV